MPHSEKDAGKIHREMLRAHGACFWRKGPWNDRVKAGASRDWEMIFLNYSSRALPFWRVPGGAWHQKARVLGAALPGLAACPEASLFSSLAPFGPAMKD